MGMDNFGHDGHNHHGGCPCGGGFEYHNYDSNYDIGQSGSGHRSSTSSGEDAEVFVKVMFLIFAILLVKVSPGLAGILFIVAIVSFFN